MELVAMLIEDTNSVLSLYSNAPNTCRDAHRLSVVIFWPRRIGVMAVTTVRTKDVARSQHLLTLFLMVMTSILWLLTRKWFDVTKKQDLQMDTFHC